MPVSESDMNELKALGMRMVEMMKERNWKLRPDSQENPDHLGVSGLKGEIVYLAYAIAEAVKRRREDSPKVVSWEEYMDLRARAQEAMERIKSLES